MTRLKLPATTGPLLAAFAAFTPLSVWAEDELETVEISATRLRGVSELETPASLSTVRMDPDSNRAQTNVTEMLSGVPGVTALDRQNHAQDTQLSIRGFGARATFGVRGLRLFADGIPATMPDGQGQLSHFSLLGADRVQILRGPFSSLYGNSSGGVVQIWSSPGSDEPSARLRATVGSHDSRSIGAQTLGTAGALDYNLAASRFETDGYRNHAAARRDSINARLGLDVGERRQLSVVLNYVDIPEAQDTLGVTIADWRLNPRQTASVATQFNTRKSVQQMQAGLIFEQRLGNGATVNVMGYGGNRQVVQYLAIPVATQNAATHSGGVVDLDSDYRGADLRLSWQGVLANRPLELTLGSNFDLQQQLRQGYNNFVGAQLGVRGLLRRDESNRIKTFDQFAQVWWQLAPRWSVLAGLRHSEINFRSTDRYVATGNPNDSGAKRYGDTTAVGGLMFRATETLRVYASVGDGFETPTFNELSYRADGGAGLAFNLQPATSRDYEIGAKWHAAGGITVDAALFRADTDNELVVARNAGGRSSFRNVNNVRREGFEAALKLPLGTQWQVQAAVTALNARFRSSFQVCSGTPCVTPNVTVAANSRLPGVPNQQAQLRLGWNPGVWNAALELNASSALVVNDIGTVRAPGYGIWHAEIGRNWQLGASTVRGFARVENLLDKTYVGSVIVNEGNSRFIETGTDRTASIGLQWRWR